MEWLNPRQRRVTTEQLRRAYAVLNPTDRTACDSFSEDYGPGNVVVLQNPTALVINQPYERLVVYEHILDTLADEDRTKFETMHKGTTYYYLSWLAFTIDDFEKAVFYMDAAISEDIRAVAPSATAWQATPAARFLLLDPTAGQIAVAITTRLAREVSLRVKRFNQRTSETFTLEVFRERVVRPHLNDSSYRSIISGFYVFVLEYLARAAMLRRRSAAGGSIEPFLTHLFKGGLTFESLLKTQYASAGNHVGSYLTAARSNLELGQPPLLKPVWARDRPQSGYTFTDVINLLPNWLNEAPQERAIAIAYAVRNTSGHDLRWPDHFTPTIYEELYEGLCDAVFWHLLKVAL